jgi:hypothetical protein
MPFQNDFAALIDGRLNGWNVHFRVARPDHQGPSRWACSHCDGCDCSENQETKRDAYPFHVFRARQIVFDSLLIPGNLRDVHTVLLFVREALFLKPSLTKAESDGENLKAAEIFWIWLRHVARPSVSLMDRKCSAKLLRRPARISHDFGRLANNQCSRGL